MKARYLKGADMRLHWMKDRVENKTNDVCWEPSATNLADYPTKHHSPAHHQKAHRAEAYPYCLHVENRHSLKS